MLTSAFNTVWSLTLNRNNTTMWHPTKCDCVPSKVIVGTHVTD